MTSIPLVRKTADVVPNPDPTILTTQQIRREAQALREVIETRLEAYDKAIGLLQSAVDREPKPPVLQADILHLKDITDRMFLNIETRFAERDKRNEQMIKDSKSLVDMTISSMEKAAAKQTETSQLAISKSEAATAKQMDQTESKFGTEIGGLNSKIDDLKTRIGAIEYRQVGVKDQKGELKDQMGLIFGLVGMAVGLVSLVVLFVKTTGGIVPGAG